MPASFHTSAFCANAPETLAMTDLSLTKGRGLSKGALSMARYGAGGKPKISALRIRRDTTR
jgi:hypothetical protein